MVGCLENQLQHQQLRLLLLLPLHRHFLLVATALLPPQRPQVCYESQSSDYDLNRLQDWVVVASLVLRNQPKIKMIKHLVSLRLKICWCFLTFLSSCSNFSNRKPFWYTKTGGEKRRCCSRYRHHPPSNRNSYLDLQLCLAVLVYRNRETSQVSPLCSASIMFF